MFAQRFVTIFNCRYHNSNHLNVCHKHTPLSPINCQSVDNCCIITMTQFTCKGVKQINNQISLNMTFTFTICISRRFSSAREFQMGNFQKYWSQNVGPDFFVLYFFHGQKILKVDGRDPQNLPPEGSHVWKIKRWLDVGSGESKAKGILFFEYGWNCPWRRAQRNTKHYDFSKNKSSTNFII